MSAVWHALQDRVGPRPEPSSVNVHLAAAADWLARAQDATPDDGVAAWYDIKTHSWQASYPETTGYIIPTLYDYAAFSGRLEFAERARRMAEWETAIQLPGGGVRAGTVDSETVAPTIFNTGQVLFGWLRAWQETGNDKFRTAANRAADWLVEAQDPDGAWRRYASPFAKFQLNAYNTRVAWALAQAGRALEDVRYSNAARANVEWALTRAQKNGWLEDNCLSDNDHPLTHTIAYSLRGIVETGALLGETRFVDFAARIARALAAAQRDDGALPGRLNADWRPAARWTCLTGNAQIAINWLRLAGFTGDDTLRAHARRANQFNMRTQRLDKTSPGLRGAIKGSFPVDGGYMAYRCPNWAAKFFMDSLMLEQGFAIG